MVSLHFATNGYFGLVGESIDPGAALARPPPLERYASRSAPSAVACGASPNTDGKAGILISGEGWRARVGCRAVG
jgi:hypothetical protein